MAEYSEYKDSGIPWIGKIPSHWDVKPIRAFLSEAKELNKEENATLLTLSQYKGVNVRNGNEDSSISAAESLIGYNVVHKGQFVMNIMLAWNGSYGVSNYDGVISPAYAVFNFKDDVCKEFYHYLWRTKAYQDAFKTRSKGIVNSRLRLYPQYFLPFYTSIPPKDEQEAIVEYLDKVTADIDKAIEAKERIIASLEERRKIIITHAVTRGINPDAPLRDSGIDWLGQIPAHWETRRLRFLCNIKTGDKDTIMRKDDGIYPFFVRSPKIERIDSYTFDTEAVLMAGDGAGAGKVFHYFKGKFGCHQRVYCLHKFKDFIYPKYAYYQLSTKFKEVFMGLSAKSTVDSVRLPMLKNFFLAIPSLDEQVKIVRSIESTLAPIEYAIIQQKKLIELLRERKNIIINETVTGKVKVI